MKTYIFAFLTTIALAIIDIIYSYNDLCDKNISEGMNLMYEYCYKNNPEKNYRIIRVKKNFKERRIQSN